jgi:hypothetical protein
MSLSRIWEPKAAAFSMPMVPILMRIRRRLSISSHCSPSRCCPHR